MALDARDASALAALLDDLRALHGEALEAVLLVGEAAGPDYRPRRSPLSVVVVLAGLDVATLRRMRARVAVWRRQRIPAPLVLLSATIARSLDVFPLELLELRDRHQILYGDTTAIDRIEVALPHLRHEVEEQLRGKRMHLIAAYLEAGAAPRALRRLLLDSSPGFSVLLRGLVYLRGGEAAPRPTDPRELIAAIERAFALELPALRRLDDVRRGHASLARRELEPLFEAYLGEVQRLETLVDAT